METLRKEPKKARSREVFDSILEAAARVLPQLDAERATTNKIAEVAGVSIGSLYQYFPNKDAILAKLMERDLARKEEALIAVIREMEGRPLPEIVDAVVARSTEVHLANPRLTRTLFIHAPRLQRVQTVFNARESVGRVIHEIVRARPEEIRLDNPDQAIFTLINAVMGVYQAWILTEPVDRLPHADLNRQLSRLILSFLRA